MQAYTNEDDYLVLDSISTGIKIVSAKHYQKLLTQIKSLQDENESLQKSNEMLTNQLEVANTKVVLAKSRQADLENENASQKALVDDLNKQKDSLFRQVFELSGQVNLLEKQLKEKESIISSFDVFLGAVVTLFSKDTEVLLNAGYWQGLFEMKHVLFTKSPKDFSDKISKIIEQNKVLAKETTELCSDTKAIVDKNVTALINEFQQKVL